MTSSPTPQFLTCDWIAPMRLEERSAAIPHEGIVYADGKILDIGRAEALASKWHVSPTHLHRSILLPGLINAHVHLELTGASVPESAWAGEGISLQDRPSRFVDWLLAVMAQSPPPGEVGEALISERTAEGIRQCLQFGVTTVGDITRNPHLTRHLLANSPLRAVSFGEVTAMASRRNLVEQRLASAMAPSPAPDRIVSAVSPHAPYSIELTGYQRCVEAASAANVPIATHLAESADESAFLARHEGPFRRLWSVLGGWDDSVPWLPEAKSFPTEFVALAGLNTPNALLVHMNYINGDFDGFARANVVYCPRTHAYFGHPPHPWRDMLSAGINVAVGTDSTASSPDLNLVDDLRLLHELAPDLPAKQIWELATVRAAKALGLAGHVGELKPGAAADFVAFPVLGSDPLTEVLERQVEPMGVWIAGNRV